MSLESPELFIDDIIREIERRDWVSSYEIYFQAMDQISGQLIGGGTNINQLRKQGVAIRVISIQKRLKEFALSLTRLSTLKDLTEPKSTSNPTILTEFPSLKKPHIGAIPGDSGSSVRVDKDFVQKFLEELSIPDELMIRNIDYHNRVKIQREKLTILNTGSNPLSSISLKFTYNLGIQSPDGQIAVNRYHAGRNLIFDQEKIFDETYSALKRQMVPKSSFDINDVDVIIHPEVIGKILAYHSSQITNKTETKNDKLIWNENLILYDDPLRDGGFNSSLFDDEGALTQSKILVENGQVVGGLSMHFSEEQGGGGNGYRSEWFQPILRSYEFPISQNITNLTMYGGAGKGNKFVDRSQTCLLILNGHGYIGGTARNPSFIIHANESELWQGGDFLGPTRNLTINGSLDEILRYGNLSADHQQVIDPAIPGAVYIGWLFVPRGLVRIH